MWNPSHVQFTVLRAKNLISKGKGGNNDVFVTIQLGKEKYQTSTIKNAHNPEWFEECDLPIPHMHSEIEVHLYHRGVISDDFLGYASIPLWEHKIGERPKSQWVSLKNKPSKQPDSKQRGDMEVKLTFHVESQGKVRPGLKKRGSSIRNLATAVGEKFKLSRSKSFRENRKDERNNTDHIQWQPENSSFAEDREASSAYLRRACSSQPNLRYVGRRSPVSRYSSIDVDREQWNSNLVNGEVMSRSYSMSAAYIKSMSLDRGKLNLNNNYTHSQDMLQVAPPSVPYNVPGNRRSCVEFANYTIAPPPYNPQEMSQDDTAIIMRGRNRTPAPRVPLSPNNSFGEAVKKHEKRMYDSIKERTEPEESTSSSDENNASLARPSRPRRNLLRDLARENDADVESICEENAAPQGEGKNGKGEIINGASGHVADRIEVGGQRDSRPDCLANGHSSRSDSRQFPSSSRRVVPVREDLSQSIQSLRRDQGHTEVILRKKSKRDRIRKLGGQGRRFTVQGLELRGQNGQGLYYDSLSSQSDSSKPNYVNHEDLLAMYRNLTKDELVHLIIKNKAQMIRKDRYIGDLESYIDDMLVRVMETQPKLLQRERPPRY